MKGLFTIRQVCQSCGLSRSTILRMEERGLLQPAFVDPETGYRYYDNNNVTLIIQVKHFLEIGISYDDSLLYFRSRGSSPELLQRLEEKYLFFKRSYEEMKVRLERREHLSFEFLEVPEYTCYVKASRGTTVDDRYQTLYNAYHEAIEKGCRLLCGAPLFIVNKRTDFMEGKFDTEPVDFICCIPLEPNEAPKDAVVFPACRAFSCLYYGDYSRLTEILGQFGEKIRELGLKPIDHMRTLCLVAPYTSLEFPKENYVSRYVLPIERQDGSGSHPNG